MSADPGFKEKVLRLFGFTPREVVEKHREVTERLDREIEATSICMREKTEEVVLETVPPERPGGGVGSVETED